MHSFEKFLVALLIALFAVGGMGAAAMILAISSSHDARAHDWYTGKKTRIGGSCCNGSDCTTLDRAWADDGGLWHFIYPKDGKEYVVPEDAIHPDEENPEPFQASGCVYGGKVLCFWRKRAGG